MGHYDIPETKLRCDGPHEWGDTRLLKSSISVVLKNNRLCLKITWEVVRDCQNEYTNNVKSAKRTCQKAKVEDRNKKYVPIDKLPER